MKKTLRFTLLLCLVVALMATVSACFEPFEQIPEATTPAQTTPDTTTPEVTTPEVTTPEVTTPEVTTPVEEPDPDQPQGSVRVDSIGGKTVVELLEKFVQDFAAASTYDFEVLHESTEDGITTSETIALKISNDALAINMNMDTMVADICFVDGMIYMNTDGQKIKLPAQSIEDVMGEGFLDGLQEGPEFSESDYEELEDAKIYLLDGTYIVTFLSTDEESGEEVPTRLEFNADGELLLMEGAGETEHILFVLNSYGKPVTVTPPADADEYVLLGSNPEIPEGAVPVDTVNGMNARQLLDKFLTEYPAAKTYDIEVLIQQGASEEEMMNLAVSVKLGESAVYFQMEMNGEAMEMWVVDSIAYLNMNGEKIKEEGLAVEEVFGEGTLESMLNSAIKEMPEIFYTFVDQAQLYELDGVYFFAISLTLPQMGIPGMSETIYFDENGNVIRIIDETEDIFMEIIVNSYGKPVEILPPADADDYYQEGATPETPDVPETDDEIYQLYVDTCTTLAQSEYLWVVIDVPDVDYADYRRFGEDRYLVAIDENEQFTEQWIVDRTGYIWIDREEFSKVAIDDDFLQAFACAEALLPVTVMEQAELQNFACYYNPYLWETTVVFDRVDEFGTLWSYEYSVSDDKTYVDVIITEFVTEFESETYTFNFMIDPDLEITLPDLE